MAANAKGEVREKINHVQFVPCLAPLEGEGFSNSALTPQRFFGFYEGIYPLWEKEFLKGNYVSIRFFDDIFHLIGENTVTSCGFTGRCSPQFVVEADGSTYVCDFYALDDWYMGNLSSQSPCALLLTPAVDKFLAWGKEKPAQCKRCTYWSLCGGGCPRMKHHIYCSQQQNFCGYKAFLDGNLENMYAIAKKVYQ